MENESDRRKSFRMCFNAEAICYSHEDDTRIKGIIRDISISGVYIEVEACPVRSGACEVHMIIVGDHSQLDISKISGQIVRCEENGVIVKFDNPLEWVALIPVYRSKVASMQQDKAEDQIFNRL